MKAKGGYDQKNIRLLIGQVTVLRGDAGGVVLELAAEPLIAKTTTIDACTVLVERQTTEVREARALEGKLHGILIAQQIFHRIDVVVLAVASQPKTELLADICNLSRNNGAITIGGVEILNGTGAMEVDTDEGFRSTIPEDVGVGLCQERQTGRQ